MTTQRHEELLSAYLDGELAPEERAQVEKWLAESAELRQLRDELCALGGSLRAIPRHKLKRDLGRTVLERAERNVLRGDTLAEAESDVMPHLSIADWWSRGAGWRRLVWPAVAVAAALLIMFFNRDPRVPERQVAQVPKGETSIAARAGTPITEKPSEVESREGPSADSASAVGRRRAEPQRGENEIELMSKAAPGSSVTAAPSAAGRVVNSAKSISPAQQAVRPHVIVCEVTPEYLRNKSFENLLEKLKVKRGSDELLRSKSLAAAKEESDRYAPLQDEELADLALSDKSRQVYAVEATREQVEQIIAEMPAESKQTKKLKESLAQAKDNLDLKAADDVAGRYWFVLQAPPAAPAAPAKSDDKP